ncbi:MAG: hypothetical protein ACPGQS_03040 [Bradymonadia bacterium]
MLRQMGLNLPSGVAKVRASWDGEYGVELFAPIEGMFGALLWALRG